NRYEKVFNRLILLLLNVLRVLSRANIRCQAISCRLYSLRFCTVMTLTIRDVAKAAGVSTATVSNVLNKTGKVGRKTHSLVVSAVKRLGYVPDAHARNLASRDRHRTLRIDYAAGVDQIVRHLYDLGHRRIAFVAGREGLKSNVARLEAYEDSMRLLGLQSGPILPGDLRFEGGMSAGLAVAKLSPRPTAVIAINDLTAVGVIKGLMSGGCRVPQDVSVTGFDKTRLAEYSNPSITTVDIHRETLGRIAADALHELSSSATPNGKEYQIGAELILGESSGPAPNVSALIHSS